jgi:hypothetical protein
VWIVYETEACVGLGLDKTLTVISGIGMGSRDKMTRCYEVNRMKVGDEDRMREG